MAVYHWVGDITSPVGLTV